MFETTSTKDFKIILHKQRVLQICPNVIRKLIHLKNKYNFNLRLKL